MKKQSKHSIRNKADKVLKEYIKSTHKGELCELCGEREFTVAHHFVYTKQSLALRYELENLILLCKGCHKYAHSWQNLFAAKITAKRGESWLRGLEELRRHGNCVKFTKEWAETKLQVLRELCPKQ